MSRDQGDSEFVAYVVVGGNKTLPCCRDIKGAYFSEVEAQQAARHATKTYLGEQLNVQRWVVAQTEELPCWQVCPTCKGEPRPKHGTCWIGKEGPCDTCGSTGLIAPDGTEEAP